MKDTNEGKNFEEKEKAFSSINLKSFLTVTILLTVLLILSGVLSYFIPQGAFLRDENDAIIPNTFQLGVVDGIAFWRVLTAPVRVFFSVDALNIIMISVFLLVMSGVFNLLEKTNGTKVFIKKLISKFGDKKKLVVIACVFVFMLFGSFFGMFEELVTLLPLVIVFMLSMGFDTMTGLGACMMAACFGFSAAITNPFSVGVAATTAGADMRDGIWLRIIFFVIIFVTISSFLLLHIKKIQKNPEKSLTFDIDLEKRKNLIAESTDLSDREKKLFKVYGIFFAVQFVLLILIASVRSISGLAIPILAVSFLVGGIICGLLVTDKKSDTFKFLGKGALAMLPAVALIAIASSIKLVMTESGIIDTIMNYVITALSGKSKFACVLLIYLLILFMQIFIGSASAKILLIIPIMMPICDALGISAATVILVYCIADGFTDVIIPTNPVLLIGLSMANVSYGKWVKWTWLVQAIILVLTVLLLWFAVSIGY